MNWLIDFFKSFFGTITMVISLVISLIEGFINFLKAIPMFFSTLVGVFNRVPSFMLVFVTITAVMSVMLFIVGRENKQ